MIEVRNLTRILINKDFFKKVAKIVLKKEKKEIDLSIVFIGPKEMKSLNQKYRGKNRVTDVLAFGQIPEFKFPKDLGEIIICPNQVKKNAKRFSTDFNKELVRVLIHSLLHLVGYGCEKFKDAKKMVRKENYYLNLFF